MLNRIMTNLPSKKPTTIFFEDSIKLGISIREGEILEVYKTVDVTSAFSFTTKTSVEVDNNLKQRLTDETISTRIETCYQQIKDDFPYHFNKDGICFWQGRGFTKNVSPVLTGKAGAALKYLKTNNEGKSKGDESLVLRIDPYIFNFFEGDYMDVFIGTLTKELVQQCYRMAFGKFDRGFLIEAIRLSLKNVNVSPILTCLPKNIYINSLLEGYCESLMKGSK